jgi:hypothetical protein
MTDIHLPVNPLFASPSSSASTTPRPSRRAAQGAAKLGGYGSMAVAAWLVTAVATGHGLAAADTTGTSSESSTSSSSTSTSSGESSAGSATTSTTGTDASSTATTGTDATATETTSGTTSSTDQVAPGVTVGSSGGAHTSTPESAAPTAPETPPDSGERATSGETAEPPQASTPPATPAPEAEQTTSNSAEPESNSSDAATVNATTPSTASTPSATAAAVVDTDADADATVAQPSAKVTESSEVPAAQAFRVNTASSALTTQTVAAAAVTAPAAPTAPVATPSVGIVGFLNGIVANLLNPFLAPAPSTPEPATPVIWAVLGWVRRQLFNQSPTITNNPTTSLQTGQTVTGNIGATDPEGDAFTYTVTEAPRHGTLTIDQATGNFTYTPDDINYEAVQTDTFTVSVADGKFNLLSLFRPHSDQETIEITVQPPTVERVILNMPAGITKPVNPRYSEDGQSILFSGTPTAGGRSEIYQIDVDGTDAKCLTCGLAAPTIATSDPSLPVNLLKPVPFYDGSGRVVVLLNNPDPRYAVFEPAGYNGIGSPARIVNVFTPDGGGLVLPPGTPLPPGLPADGIINREREMRPSPDGTHVLFTRIVIGQTGNFQALPIVGALTPDGDHYDVTNARVVWPTGESKQWTPDGKGVIIQGGAIDAGGVDDIMVDLSGQTGDILFPGSPYRGIRVTGNLDYDEDIDMSPNMAWITVGSTRGFEALTPMTRIVRQNFLPVYVAAPIYDHYADGQVRNVSNQNWAVAVEDDLNRENGIPLFVQDDPTTPGVDEGDGWASRSMPSWNTDGTAVTFWESGNGDEHGVPATESRIVIANLKYTTSVGPVGDTTTVFNPSAFPDLTTYVAKTTPLPPTGTYNGVGGGTAEVSEAIDPTTFQTTRTVKYINYVNEDGLILNGTESAIYGPSQTSVTYLAAIKVTDATGATRGSLDADAAVTLLPTQTVTGYITSTLDGDTQTIPDFAKAEAVKTGA